MAFFFIEFVLFSCRPRHNGSSSLESSLNLNDPENIYWVQKASRALRGGASLTQKDIATLNGLSAEQIIEKFFQDPLFVQSMTMFNLYYLGFLSEKTRTNLSSGKLNMRVMSSLIFDFPAAFNAALETFKTGNFFVLFDPVQDVYFDGAENPRLDRGDFPHLSDDDFSKIRHSDNSTKIDALRNRIEFLLEELKTLLSSQNPQYWRQACDLAFKELDFKDPNSFEIKYPFTAIAKKTVGAFDDDKTLKTNLPSKAVMTKLCAAKNIDPVQIRAAFGNFELEVRDLVNFYISTLYPIKVASVQSCTDLLNISKIKNYFKQDGWSSRMWSVLPNTSTNMNRKRGAYALKTFFCDDLTPIDFSTMNQMPIQHSKTNAHASIPKCAS